MGAHALVLLILMGVQVLSPNKLIILVPAMQREGATSNVFFFFFPSGYKKKAGVTLFTKHEKIHLSRFSRFT